MILDGSAGGPDAAPRPPPATPRPPRPAALSVAASDPAIEASKVQYDSTGGTKVTGYLARPKAAGSYPGVLVIHENRGLNDHIRDVARRLAKANFIALAPDLTSRGGTTDTLDPDMARTFLGAAVATDWWPTSTPASTSSAPSPASCAADRIGVTGFCFGGGYTYRATAASPKIAAAASYYGPIQAALIDQLKRHQRRRPDPPRRERQQRERDHRPARGAALPARPTSSMSHPGTNHAFNNDTGANYNEAAAVRAWGQTLDWFNTHLRR